MTFSDTVMAYIRDDLWATLTKPNNREVRVYIREVLAMSGVATTIKSSTHREVVDKIPPNLQLVVLGVTQTKWQVLQSHNILKKMGV